MRTIKIDDKSLKFEVGHSMQQYYEMFGNDDELWNFPIEELIDGTIEPNEDMTYWLINGRFYETNL